MCGIGKIRIGNIVENYLIVSAKFFHRRRQFVIVYVHNSDVESGIHVGIDKLFKLLRLSFYTFENKYFVERLNINMSYIFAVFFYRITVVKRDFYLNFMQTVAIERMAHDKSLFAAGNFDCFERTLRVQFAVVEKLHGCAGCRFACEYVYRKRACLVHLDVIVGAFDRGNLNVRSAEFRGHVYRVDYRSLNGKRASYVGSISVGLFTVGYQYYARRFGMSKTASRKHERGRNIGCRNVRQIG